MQATSKFQRECDACKYVRDYYGVPAELGRRVIVDGQPGIIIKDMGEYIGVNLDDDKPGVVSPCHPTWRVEYGEMGHIRRATRSQRRYQRYLDVGECFDSFRDFLLHESAQEKKQRLA